MVVLGCTPDARSPSEPAALSASGPRATLIAELASNPAIGSPTDIAAIEMDLPELPRPYDQSDSALAAALTESSGRAFIGLKGKSSSRAVRSVRMVTDDMSPPGRRVPKALRGALSASDVSSGLNELAGLGLEVLRYYENVGIAFVQIPAGHDLGKLREHPHVDYIEPDIHGDNVAIASRAPPSLARRPESASLFATSSTASMSQSTPWGVLLMRAPDAWPYSTGASARMLIVDSGHERGHEDLPFVPLGNCLGAYSGCSDPIWPAGLPHGSHVTGIAVALENGLGVVGVAKGLPSSNLYSWGACDDALVCPHPEIIASLNWATGNLGGLGIINMSLTGKTFSQPYANAIAAASAAGHVIVAAAGNSGTNQIRYPAAYSNVLGVAAILPTKAFAGTIAPCPAAPGKLGSSWGNHVDFVAPWYALSTVTPNSYGDESTPPYWCGTSMATPHVAAVAALIRSRYPLLNAGGVYTRLRDTAEPLGPAGWDDHYGFGLPRAHLAVTFDRPVVTASIASGKARLSWFAIPFATEYRVYRRVTPTLCPQWELYGATGTTSYTDNGTDVSSVYGYDSYPQSQVAVSYAVTAFAEGIETVLTQYATFIPTGNVFC